jgi:hypothetical protein
VFTETVEVVGVRDWLITLANDRRDILPTEVDIYLPLKGRKGEIDVSEEAF